MSTHRHTLTAVALSFATIAAAPAMASAAAPDRFISYSADVSATVKHGLNQHWETADDAYTRTIDSSSRVASHMNDVTIRKEADGDASLLHDAWGDDALAKTSGSVKASYVSRANGTLTASCAPSGSDDWGGSAITPSRLPALGGSVALNVRIASNPQIDWRCTGAEIQAQPFLDYHRPADDGEGSHDFFMLMPDEAVGQGKFIQLMKGPATGNSFCPGSGLISVTQCTFSWTGTLTMVKTGETVVEPEGPVAQPPAPGGPAAPAPTGPQKPSGSGARPSAGTPKVDPKTGDVKFRVTCPSGCAGSAAISVPKASGGAASAAALKSLVKLRFSVPKGRASTVRLRVSKKTRRAMRKAGRARIAVTLIPKRGTVLKRTFSVKAR